jgi:hypothetical protein
MRRPLKMYPLSSLAYAYKTVDRALLLVVVHCPLLPNLCAIAL